MWKHLIFILSRATTQGAPDHDGVRTCGGLWSGLPAIMNSIKIILKADPTNKLWRWTAKIYCVLGGGGRVFSFWSPATTRLMACGSLITNKIMVLKWMLDWTVIIFSIILLKHPCVLIPRIEVVEVGEDTSLLRYWLLLRSVLYYWKDDTLLPHKWGILAIFYH